MCLDFQKTPRFLAGCVFPASNLRLSRYKTHNHELTEEYKRVTKQFKDLQVDPAPMMQSDMSTENLKKKACLSQV